MTHGITADQATYRLKQALGTTHTTETWHINRACNAYAKGQLDLTRLEQAVEHVLRGGYLSEKLEPRSPLMDKVRRHRLQRDCQHHDLIDIAGFDTGPRYLCATCGTDSTPWLDEHPT